MEPRVQYARTTDGVNIAFTVDGEGPSLVYMQPYSHQQLDWRYDEMRDYYEALAEHRTIIRFDIRNFGLSQRDVGKTSSESLLLDLEAVVAKANIDRFDLVGVSGLGLIAARYAATHSERVRRLILWAVPSDGGYFSEAPRTKSLLAISEFDEELTVELQARYVFGDDVTINEQRQSHVRETMTAPALAAYIRGLFEFDITADLPTLTCPTLVVYPRLHSYLTTERAQQVAASIPQAEFAIVDSGYYPYQGAEAANCVRLFHDFLSADEEPKRTQDAAPSAFQTIMFTDLESSTALTQKLGDDVAQGILHGHNDAVRKALEEHGGREVKHTGDGIMAAFPSAVRAVAAALQIQRDLAGGEVRVRIGLNAGEPIAEDDDFFGTAVQLAARICDRAEPGQVLVSNVVRELCAGKKLKFDHQSEATLKGFDEPVRTWSVEW